MYDNMYASEMNSGPGIVFWIFYIIFVVFMIFVQWKIYVKAGKPGWGCIVPIYNIILQLEIAGRPIWWIFLMFIPLVNTVIAIIINQGAEYFVILAWLFVALRYVHTYIHTTYNHIIHRLFVFASSVIILLLMWVKVVLLVAAQMILKII